MENASKALIMAAEILLGVLLLSLLAMVFYGFNNYQSEVDKNQSAKELYEFNAKFQAYESYEYLTPQDVLSISNMVKDYNKRFGEEGRIQITGVSNPTHNNDFLNPEPESKYKIKIKYSDIDGKVEKIIINKTF